MINDLLRDIQIAWRVLTRDRAFTFVAVLVLGMGIGIVNLQLVLINAFGIRGLPIPDVDRVLFLNARAVNTNRDLSLAYDEFDAIQREGRSFSNVAAFTNTSVVLGDEGRSPDRALSTLVTPALFKVLAEHPALGRDFEPADDRPGAAAVVMLSHDVWTTRYAGDRSIIGRTIRINGAPTVVIGVMAAGFKFPINTEVWQPLAALPEIMTDGRDGRRLSVVGRLRPAATLAGANGELVALGSLLPDTPAAGKETRLRAIPINEKYNAKLSDPTWIAFMSVGVIVLLVACANAANLLLMRSVRRGQEMAVRASLGASRRRLVRQLLTESAVLAALGGVAGIGLSLIGVRLVTSIMPASTLAYYTKFTMDGGVLAVLCAICLGTVFVFGLAPAAQVSRTDISRLMTDGGRSNTGGLRSRRLTAVFLTAEFGLTMVMLASLALSVRISRRTDRLSTEVDPTNLMTASITLSGEHYNTSPQRAQFYKQLEERLMTIPGLASAAVTTALPLGGGRQKRLTADARTLVTGDSLTIWMVSASPRYFQTLQLPLLRGSALAERGDVAVVNQQLATLLFPKGDAVGHRIRLADPAPKATDGPWLTIVGVSPTVRQRTVNDPDPVVYLPLANDAPEGAQIVVAGKSDDGSVVPLLRDAVRGIDPDVPLYRVMSLEQAMLDIRLFSRLSSGLLTSIASVALLLAAIGLYAVSAHAVMQRRKEIGVRMALGARRSKVAWMIVRRASVQLAFGLAAGVLCTMLFEKFVGLGPDTSGYHMSDPLTLIGAATLLVAVTAVACVAPAYRAATLEPVQALRND